MSLPRVLSKTMGWKAFSLSYKGLLGLGIMIVDEVLKYSGKYPKLMRELMHELAMLTMLVRHESCLIMNLR